MHLQSLYNVTFYYSSGYIAMQFEDSEAHDLSKEQMDELIPMPPTDQLMIGRKGTVKPTLPFRSYEIQLEDRTTRR